MIQTHSCKILTCSTTRFIEHTSLVATVELNLVIDNFVTWTQIILKLSHWAVTILMHSDDRQSGKTQSFVLSCSTRSSEADSNGLPNKSNYPRRRASYH